MKYNLQLNIIGLLGMLIAASAALRIASYSLANIPLQYLSTYTVVAIISLFILPLVFLIAKKLTNNDQAALFSVALVAAVPTYSWKTVDSITKTIALLLFFITIVAFMYARDKYWLAIIPALLMATLHPYSLALTLLFVVYLILVTLEGFELEKSERNLAVIIASIVPMVFTLFTLTEARLAISKQYIAAGYYSLKAGGFSLIQAFTTAGALPIYLGILGSYFGVLKKVKHAALILSGAAVFFIATLTNVVPERLVLPYFVILLACASSFLYLEFDQWIMNSKLNKHKNVLSYTAITTVLIIGAIHWLTLLV